MCKYKIIGGKQLYGTIKVSGSKNALLPILAASCICKDIIILNNIPPLEDTYAMMEILRYLNVRVIYDNKDKVIIDSRNIKNRVIPLSLTKKLRASYYFIGALLSLFNTIKIGIPGGCSFSSRPIDLHLFSFDKIGYAYDIKGDMYSFKKSGCTDDEIRFSKVSVGATINSILALVKSKYTFKIYNYAREPEVMDLINFLNMCGAKIIVNDEYIKIEGVEVLSGANYTIIDDRIEAQTYLILGALTSSKLNVIYKNHNHISALCELFNNLGIDLKETNNGFIVRKSKEICARNLVFDVYPFLPTDIQPILSLLFTKTKGESVFVDNVYPKRYSQVDELVSMGYNMKFDDNKLYIRKNASYLNSRVISKDLRGGASLVVAALLSDKETIVENILFIKRGYYNLVNKLRNVGANIEEI